MLYYISDTIVKQVDSGQQEVISMLDNLYRAWLNGRCLIDGKRTTLQNLSKHDCCEGYKNVLHSKQGISNIYNYLDFYVILVYNTNFNADASPTHIQNATARYLDFQTINDERIFSNNNLLCEHVEDAIVYRWGSNFIFTDDVRNVQINVTNQLGGGNTIKDDATNYHDQKQLTLCILDSDKHHPNDVLGQTATEFLSQYNVLQSKFLWYYIIESHEVENLIPVDLLYFSNCINHKFYKTFNSLDFKNQVVCTFFKYWDNKQGFKPSDLRVVRNDYSEDLESVKALLKVFGVKEQRINAELKRAFDKSKNPALLNGIKSDSLSLASDYIKQNQPDKFLFKLKPYQEHDWDRISRKVWSIGCASMPKRV